MHNAGWCLQPSAAAGNKDAMHEDQEETVDGLIGDHWKYRLVLVLP